MNYIYPTTTVSFKTHLICKVIDYGRSYFYANDAVNSVTTYQSVCKQCIDEEEPDNKCGYYNGYNWFVEEDPPSESFYILSSAPNISHDMRLLSDFKWDSHLMKRLHCGMNELFKDLLYQSPYGTPARGSSPGARGIYNIHDATARLQQLVVEGALQAANDRQYQDCVCVGTMNVYMDPASNKSMTYEPVF